MSTLDQDNTQAPPREQWPMIPTHVFPLGPNGTQSKDRYFCPRCGKLLKIGKRIIQGLSGCPSMWVDK